MSVVTNAQVLRSAWLRSSVPSHAPLGVRIGPIKGPYAAAAVWNQWWFPTVVRPSQAQKLLSMWFRTSVPSFSPISAQTQPAARRIAPTIRSSYSGQTIWENWWWNTAYVPIFRGTFTASGAVYAYVGESAFLIFPHPYSLFLFPALFLYEGTDSHADMGLSEDPLPYGYLGGDAGSFIGHSRIISTTGGAYIFTGEPITFKVFEGTFKGPLLSTSTRVILGPKRAGEQVSVPFDFSHRSVAGDIISAPTVSVSVWSGVDPAPQTIYLGSVLQGMIVYVSLVGGTPGTIYQVSVSVASTEVGRLELDAFLSILPLGL